MCTSPREEGTGANVLRDKASTHTSHVATRNRETARSEFLRLSLNVGVTCGTSDKRKQSDSRQWQARGVGRAVGRRLADSWWRCGLWHWGTRTPRSMAMFGRKRKAWMRAHQCARRHLPDLLIARDARDQRLPTAIDLIQAYGHDQQG